MLNIVVDVFWRLSSVILVYVDNEFNVIELNDPALIFPLTYKLPMHVVLAFNVVYPLTFKLLIHVIGCDNCLTATYDNEDEVVIFAGVGINAKSPIIALKIHVY